MTNEEFHRLPLNIEPINYVLTLKPNLNDFVFGGEVEIEIKIKTETNQILLNSIELEFDKATLDYKLYKIDSESIKFCEKSEVATINFKETLEPGIAILIIKFTGILNEKLKGFYRSVYQLPSGEQKYAAVTQFEAIDARRAFPCWDEPSRKATFDVRIIAGADQTVVSNMPLIESHVVDSKLRKFIFSRSPRMSTYLLAFIIGEFDFVEGFDKNGILIRVYTPVGKKEFGKYALNVSLKTIPFYTDYFSIGYPLPKLDLIAIGEMSPGAMENWGLITYREDCLLLDPENSSLETKRYVATIVGHEIAHQWFGNLVTMEWWTDLWLNEGFASWIEYLCVDHVTPEFDIWTHFVATDYQSALELDSLKTSHPIEVKVDAPSEIDEIFDAISYCKGATTIRMLHDYIGDEAYRRGLYTYLEKYKFSNAVTENLWQHLGDASQKPVYELMQLWTKQTGYPVVQVSKSINSNNEVILKLSQRRFFVNGSIPDETEDYLWKIPIKILTKSSYPNVYNEFLLERRNDEVNIGHISELGWIKLNKNSIGIYRTQYSTEMLFALIEPVKTKILHATDRLGLQDDVFNLAQAGLLSTVDILKFFESYVDEEESTVWKGLLGNLGALYTLLLQTDFSHRFSSFLKKLLKPISKKLGWNVIPGENNLQSICRSTVLKVLGKIGDEETIDEAKRRFSNHLNGDLISADLRTAVYTAVLADANEELVDKFIQLHDKCDFQEEKVRLACALGVVKDKKLIEKILKFAISPSVRSQDSVSVIESIACSMTSRYSQAIAWEFVKNNWAFLNSRYSTGFMIMDLVKATTEGFSSKEMYDDVKEFFISNPTPGAIRTIQQSLENILKNEAWLKRDEKILKEFLSLY